MEQPSPESWSRDVCRVEDLRYVILEQHGGEQIPSDFTESWRADEPIEEFVKRHADTGAPDWHTPPWVWQCFVGVSDLAYMMVRFWFPERRRSLEKPLLRRYHQRLLQQGVNDYSWEDLMDDYRMSVIFSLYVTIEEAVRTAPTKWYPQLHNAAAAFEELNCRDLLEQHQNLCQVAERPALHGNY